jgi:hypothetical protein
VTIGENRASNRQSSNQNLLPPRPTKIHLAAVGLQRFRRSKPDASREI